MAKYPHLYGTGLNNLFLDLIDDVYIYLEQFKLLPRPLDKITF